MAEMMTETDTEVIKGQLCRLNEKMSELAEYQRIQNGKVAEHEKWINRREVELDAMEDRFRMVEEQVDSHQAFIDRNEGAKAGIGELVTRIIMFVGMLATLYGVWIKH